MGPSVKIPDGLLRGNVATSVLGYMYFSFQGIPYAKPPIGPLRFEPPQRVDPWTGEKNAMAPGPHAPAMNNDLTPPEFLDGSDEDCLYLNVYTRELKGTRENPKKPVMFFIHGGGYVGGSGSDDLYGPDYLLAKDVVLVTIDYRVGALGFLSLQNEACPGNNGLRDMVEALKWVKRSIAEFGGDENNVTIFGNSAGGTSVQFLMLSELSRGLFHKAICQSGAALSPASVSVMPVRCAFALGKALGFRGTKKDELLDFLRSVPARDIVEKSEGVRDAVFPHWPMMTIFAPVVEPPSPNAFLEAAPEELFRQGHVHDIPYMAGIVEFEGPGILAMGKGSEIAKSKEGLEQALLPPYQAIDPGSELANSIIDEIKSFYFQDGFDRDKFLKVMSWVYFVQGFDEATRRIVDIPNRDSKSYVYLFTHNGGNVNYWKTSSGLTDLKGTMHSDEIPFLFYQKSVKLTFEEGSANAKVRDDITKLWADFARTGDPTPDGKLWKPYSNDNKNYLDIGASQVLKRNLYEEEANFWTRIFEKIKQQPITKL